MKKRFTEVQIVAAIKKQEAGIAVKDICREIGISDATFYNWKARYGGMEVSDVKRMKELEAENAQLKSMYAEASMENRALKNLIEKKFCCFWLVLHLFHFHQLSLDDTSSFGSSCNRKIRRLI